MKFLLRGEIWWALRTIRVWLYFHKLPSNWLLPIESLMIRGTTVSKALFGQETSATGN